VVESLPSKPEAPSSNPSAKTNKQTKTPDAFDILPEVAMFLPLPIQVYKYTKTKTSLT
jgi:hypothetical protein